MAGDVVYRGCADSALSQLSLSARAGGISLNFSEERTIDSVAFWTA